MQRTIQAGEVVLCLDDEGFEHIIREGHFYTVERTDKEGLIVYLEHSSEPMAAMRFESLNMAPGGGHSAYLRQEFL